jgi:hypothetical protein
MSRRLPVLPLTLAATVGLFALTSALTAQPQPQPAATGGAGSDPIKRTEEENLKLFKRFADELLKLAQKWEKSDNPDDKERAKSLRQALKIADEKGVENMFKQMVNLLNGKTPNFGGLQSTDAALIKALKDILETLNTEDEAERLRREIKDLEALLKEAARIKREEENLRARTEGKGDPNRIAKDQNQLAKETQKLANQLNKGDPKNGNNKGDEPKDDKAEQKPEAKPGDPSGEPKSDTQDPKGAGKEQSGMGEPKAGDPKPGDPKSGLPMAGSSKEPPKAGMDDPMGAKGMGEPKPMTGDARPMPPSDGKPQGDGKGNGKPSKGQGGDAKPMSPKGGQPSDSPPPSGSKGRPSGSPSGSPSSPRPPNPNNPNDEAQRKVEEAVPDQKDAEKNLNENKRDEASKKEDDAIKKLADAIKELEKRLKQLREKEMLKKLEDLERRVAKMLAMQTEVYEATKRLDTTIKKNNNQPTTADRQRSGVEGEKEGAIAEEAEKALRLLEGEGTAVVFAGVLAEAKKDMEAVQKQLNAVNVGPDTQLVEEQIIAQLKRMLEALKKAKQDLQNPPPPPPPGSPPGEQKKNLIQLVEQLKLLKSLQIQVNERTAAFGKRTPGEQAGDPFIQEQLKQLGDRQKTLQDMLHKIAAMMNQ